MIQFILVASKNLDLSMVEEINSVITDLFGTDDICINFTDEGILCFYIDKEKLKCKDFSDVRIMQIYS